MAANSKYKVIVSDRAKRMLGTHIRFMAQVNKGGKEKRDYGSNALFKADATAFPLL